MRFDNVFVQPYVRSAVTGVYSDAYRDIVAEGDVAFHAVLNPPDGGWPKGLKAEFSFLGADGTKAVVPAATLKDDEAAVTVPAERLAKGTHKVVFTLSGADGGVLGESSLDFARVDELPPRAAYVDRHQRLVVDGKPFFPLGMYWGEITAERLDIYTNAPFNCLMPYACPTRAQLDLCAARGLKSFANIKSFRNRDLEKRIKALMDHPALMAWYVIDEAPLADLDSYVSLYRTLREADSQHPAWAVMDRLDDIRDFLPTCDIMGFDPYPVAQRPIGLVLSSHNNRIFHPSHEYIRINASVRRAARIVHRQQEQAVLRTEHLGEHRCKRIHHLTKRAIAMWTPNDCYAPRMPLLKR